VQPIRKRFTQLITKRSKLPPVRKPPGRRQWSPARLLGFASLLLLGLVLSVAAQFAPKLSDRLSLKTAETFSAPINGLRTVTGKTLALGQDLAALADGSPRRRDGATADRDATQYWRNRAEELEIENARLRKQLEVPLPADRAFLTVRIFGGPSGPYSRSVLIDAGADEGVTEGAIVTAGGNLAGRVVSVARHTGRVLLISDPNSQVPVRVDPQGIRGILVGDGTALPELRFLAGREDVVAGSRVVTSGSGGVFLPDILVGHLDSSTGRVTPEVRLQEDIHYLRVLMPRLAEDLPSPGLVAGAKPPDTSAVRARTAAIGDLVMQRRP